MKPTKMSDTTQLKFRGTKGEWQVFEGHNPGIDAPRKSIILYGEEEESHGIRGKTTIEAKANAHLMAASPQLLEACQKTLDTLIQVKKRYEKTLTDAAYSAISHRINDLTTAINKALNYEK